VFLLFDFLGYADDHEVWSNIVEPRILLNLGVNCMIGETIREIESKKSDVIIPPSWIFGTLLLRSFSAIARDSIVGVCL
jgi:hypothetical protein